jgi:SAM-dependent methyltransferase
MCFEVLKSKAEIEIARGELRRRELSFTSPWWKHLATRLGISKEIEVGDKLKSWDVLKTVNFIERNVSPTARILDIGAFASELPCILHSLNYSELVGIDLNPDIKKMPYAGAVHYEVSNFTQTAFASGSFQAITAISVIEHGFNSKLLLPEVSRLLDSQGYFIASVDYWPEKIETDGVRFFGMDWKIFSAAEIHALLDEAIEYNLFPYGEMNLAGQDKATIRCEDRDYTFAWLVLQKRPPVMDAEADLDRRESL